METHFSSRKRRKEKKIKGREGKGRRERKEEKMKKGKELTWISFDFYQLKYGSKLIEVDFIDYDVEIEIMYRNWWFWYIDWIKSWFKYVY